MIKEEDLAKTIGWNINALLLRADKTQIDLAEYLGVAKSTVSMWVNGVRVPRMARIDAMARFFGVNRSDIMEPWGEPHSAGSVSIPVYARVAAGLPFDIIHGISNIFTGMLVLPFSELIKKLMRQFGRN